MTLPIRPARTASAARTKRWPNSVRCWLPVWNATPAFCTAGITSCASRSVSVSGFSQ